LLPTVSPSPAVRWRSTDTEEQVFAWDFTDREWLGDSIALPVLAANFRAADLDYYDGSDWQTAGTLDLATGFTGLSADLRGSVLTPATGTDAGGRYVAEGELAGGTAVGNVARRIRWNSAGSWTGTTTTPQIRVQLEGIDGTEDYSEGVDLVWPSGVLVVHLAAEVVRRRWRVRIPADQLTPDGCYTAGSACPLALRVIGQAPSWGWSRERAPNASTSTSRRGTTRARALGPTLDTWSMSWSEGVDLFELRNAGEPDFVGPEDGFDGAGTAVGDVPWLLGGLLDLAESGAVPCVALAVVPDSGETLTDPSLWLYGRFTASVRADHVVGDEGEAEVVRVGEFVVAGIV
jgi:hypothetical protein